MFLQTIIRFISASVGALVAFYFAAHAVYAMGRMDPASIYNVDQMFKTMLKPIASLDWSTQKTMIVVGCVTIVQLCVLERLFGRWAYKPVEETDMVEPAARAEA